MELVYHKYADIWSGHITKNDNELLQTKGISSKPGIAVEINEFNTIVFPDSYLGTDENMVTMRANLKNIGFSQTFIDIVVRASEEGAYAIKFDSDGTQYDYLPTFGW
jgi:hypothetical protein